MQISLPEQMSGEAQERQATTVPQGLVTIPQPLLPQMLVSAGQVHTPLEQTWLALQPPHEMEAPHPFVTVPQV